MLKNIFDIIAILLKLFSKVYTVRKYFFKDLPVYAVLYSQILIRIR